MSVFFFLCRKSNFKGKPDDQALAELWSTIGADGFNGDTMCGIPEDFFQASLDIGYPLGTLFISFTLNVNSSRT